MNSCKIVADKKTKILEKSDTLTQKSCLEVERERQKERQRNWHLSNSKRFGRFYKR